jgi:Putative zinc-finger
VIFESCLEIRGHFSDFVDGVCERSTIRSIRYHLQNCASCSEELARCQALKEDLRALARYQVPADLALRLRVQISRELHKNALGRLIVRLENSLRPLVLSSVAGTIAAVACIALAIGIGVPRSNNTPDIPLSIVTPPRVEELAPMTFDTGDRPVVLVTYVNSRGEVTSYKVLSGQRSPQLMQRLDRMLYFSVFQPATSFGTPTNGRIVLSLRRITVRG